jgi:hypothetical protein
MRLNKTKREVFRKRVKNVIKQIEKSEIVNHFQKERNFYYSIKLFIIP